MEAFTKLTLGVKKIIYALFRDNNMDSPSLIPDTHKCELYFSDYKASQLFGNESFIQKYLQCDVLTIRKGYTGIINRIFFLAI